MILPGAGNFLGVIGTTFDAVVTIYLLQPGEVNWTAELTWNASVSYNAKDGVVGSNGKAYKSKAGGNLGNDPTTDGGVHWETIAPKDMTGCQVVFKMGSVELTSTPAAGITLGGAAGTIALEMTPSQTAGVAKAGDIAYSLTIKEPSTKLYEYLKGNVTWQTL
jgi:hypothetical protein